MNTPIESTDHWRPMAYVAMADPTAIVNVLERAGWTVIQQPSGFHLVHAIAGVIEGHRPWLRPGLIVVDAHARGCAGTTIAAGLRDLGITIPIVLIAAPGEALPVSPDRTLRIVDRASAETTVAELAEICDRASGLPQLTDVGVVLAAHQVRDARDRGSRVSRHEPG